MRALRNIVLCLLGVILLVTALLLTVDLGRFHSTIEKFASDAVGRPVTIDGQLSIRVGRRIEVTAHNAWIADADWTGEKALAQVGRGTIVIDTASLLFGPVQITYIRLDEPRIRLATNADGDVNWPLGGGGADSAAPMQSLPVTIEDAVVTDLELTIAAPDRQQPLNIRAQTMSLRGSGNESLLLEADGMVNTTPFTVRASAATADTVLALADVELAVSGSLGEIAFDGSVAVASLQRPRKPVARLRLEGPNAEYLTDILGLDRATTGPLDLNATLLPEDGIMALEVQGVFGEFNLQAQGRFDALDSLQRVDGTFSTSGPDASRVGSLLGFDTLPAEPFEITGQVHKQDTQLSVKAVRVGVGISELTVDADFSNFPDPRSGRAKFAARGPQFGHFNRMLGLPGQLTGPFTANGTLVPGDDGGASVDITVSAADIELVIEGDIANADRYVGSTVRLSAHGPDISAVADAAGINSAPTTPFEVSLVATRGDTTTAIDALSVELANMRLTARGTVSDSPQINAEIDFTLDGSNLAASVERLGQDASRLPAARFEVTGGLRWQDSELALRGVTANVNNDAGLSVTVDGTLANLPQLTGSSVRLDATGKDLSAVAPFVERLAPLDQPFRLAALASIGTQELNLRQLEATYDGLVVSGEVDLGLSPFAGEGRFALRAASPNVMTLLTAATGRQFNETARLKADAQAAWVGNAWSVETLSMALGKSTLQAGGTLDGPPGFENTNLQGRLDVPDLSRYAPLVGRELPAEPAMIEFGLAGTEQDMTVEPLRATLGASDLEGRVRYVSGDIPRLELTLNAKRLNLAPFLPDPATATAPPTSTGTDRATVSSPARSPDRLIPDLPIPIDKARQVNIIARLDVAALQLRQHTLTDVGITGRVGNGVIELSRAQFTSARAERFDARATLRPAQAGASLLLQADGSSLITGLPATSREELASLPRYDVTAVLQGTGSTTQELAASLDGYVRLVAGPGRVKAGRGMLFTNDFVSSLFTTVNPFAKTDSHTNYKCAVALVTLSDGLVEGKPAVVLLSDQLKVIASAKIDLSTEKIDVSVNTVPQKGLGISVTDLVNPYVRIGGTLARPSLVLDPQGAVIQGGAAVATGGLTFLAKRFQQRFFSSRDPCGAAVAEADPVFQQMRTAILGATVADEAVAKPDARE